MTSPGAMLEAEGTVVKTGPDGVFVETSRASACGSCSSQNSCGTTGLSQLLGSKKSAFKVLDPIGAAVGERVVIGVAEAALLKSALLAYLLPLALLLAGAVLAGLPAPAHLRDAYAGAGAIAGLILGLAALKLASARAGTQRQYQPVILRRAFSHNFVKFAEDRE